MTPVEERLRRRIALTGPISVADFMAACLTDPDGYYARKDPFGAAGDFVTAPEISPLFGELIGAWLLEQWHRDGCPAPIDLVELGPGLGTLMHNILKVTACDPRFLGASRIVLVEASERLRRIQRNLLLAQHPRVSFADAPTMVRPTYLLANEFFDALPLRQFERRGGAWHERLVELAGHGLQFALCEMPAPFGANGPEGAVREVSDEASKMIKTVASGRVRTGVGVALIIDYGYENALSSETLQAVERHEPVDLFHRPGEVDVSAHVDFSALAEVARRSGAHVSGPVEQGAYLRAIGLHQRAAASKNPASAGRVEAAVRTLSGDGPGEMGTLFKVMALTPGRAELPGF